MSPENAFFRGRGNSGFGPVSPVRSRKARRRWFRNSVRTTLVALGLLGGAVIANAGWSFLHNDGAFGVRQIHVVGLVAHEPQVLRDALADLRGRNLFALGPEEVSKRFAAFPWLKGFLCKKHLPDTLIVEVAERRELCTVGTSTGNYAIDGAGMAWPVPSGAACTVALSPGLIAADAQVQSAVTQLLRLDLRGAVQNLAPGDTPGALTLVCPNGWRLQVAPDDIAAGWQRFQVAKAWAATHAPDHKALDLRWAGKVVLLPEAPAATPQEPQDEEGGTVNG